MCIYLYMYIYVYIYRSLALFSLSLSLSLLLVGRSRLLETPALKHESLHPNPNPSPLPQLRRSNVSPLLFIYHRM